MANNRYKLATGGTYTPVAFQGNTREFIMPDVNLYANVVQHQNALEAQNAQGLAKYREARGALQKAFAEAELKINEKDIPFFREYADEQLSKLDDAIAIATAEKKAGNPNYSNNLITDALGFASQLGGETARVSALMMKRNAEYEQNDTIQKQRVASGKISQETYDWWKEQNPFVSDYTKDEQGRVITGGTYKPNSVPVDDINWDKEYQAAFSTISPNKGVAYEVTENGIISNQWDNVTLQRILDNLHERMQNPELNAQINQAYSVAKNYYKNLEAKLNDSNLTEVEKNQIQQQLNKDGNRFYRNGTFVGLDEFYLLKTTNSNIVKNMAYSYNSGKIKNATPNPNPNKKDDRVYPGVTAIEHWIEAAENFASGEQMNQWDNNTVANARQSADNIKNSH